MIITTTSAKMKAVRIKIIIATMTVVVKTCMNIYGNCVDSDFKLRRRMDHCRNGCILNSDDPKETTMISRVSPKLYLMSSSVDICSTI